MKKLCTLLKTAIWCLIGVFLGSTIYTILDEKAHPGLYEMQSAPWYTGVLLGAGVTAVLVLVLAVVLAVLSREMNKNPQVFCEIYKGVKALRRCRRAFLCNK